MSSLSGLAGSQALALVVGCGNTINNAAYFTGFLDATSDFLRRMGQTRPEMYSMFDGPGVYALAPGSVIALTAGETLTDDEIKQVARHLTERLSDSEPANWPIYMSEIIADVRMGSRVYNPAEILRELITAAVNVWGVPDGDWRSKKESELADVVEKARALLAELDGEGSAQIKPEGGGLDG